MSAWRAGWVWAFGCLVTACAVASPARLRLCVSDQPFMPYTHPDGSGRFQQRVLAAARGLDLVVEQYAAPRARCLLDSRQGRADALIGVFSPERKAWLSFPMRDGQPLADQAIGRIRVVVLRRVGSPVAWDGQRLTGLGDRPLGLRFGFAYGLKLNRLGVPLDDKAMSSEQLIAKLAKGRVGAALLTDEALSQQAKWPPGQVEVLPEPFDTLALYLIVTQEFQARHAQLVEAVWSRLGAMPG